MFPFVARGSSSQLLPSTHTRTREFWCRCTLGCNGSKELPILEPFGSPLLHLIPRRASSPSRPRCGNRKQWASGSRCQFLVVRSFKWAGCTGFTPCYLDVPHTLTRGSVGVAAIFDSNGSEEVPLQEPLGVLVRLGRANQPPRFRSSPDTRGKPYFGALLKRL